MTVTVQISTSSAHRGRDLARNNSITLAVQQSLERDGVAQKDIQTTGLSLQENYPPSPAGFEVGDEVSATLHNLTRAGAAIDDAVSTAGDAGRLDGVTFSMSDTSPLMGAARQRAVALARADAEQLAVYAGERVVGLHSLTDQTDQEPSAAFPGRLGPAAGSASRAAVPAEPGTQQLSVVVSGLFGTSAAGKRLRSPIAREGEGGRRKTSFGKKLGDENVLCPSAFCQRPLHPSAICGAP